MEVTVLPASRSRRATRARFTKVRTGCVTCKRRHVKCDETKPCCKNCIKWAGFCGGYEGPRGLTSAAADSAQTASKARRVPQSRGEGRPLADRAASLPRPTSRRSSWRPRVEPSPPPPAGPDAPSGQPRRCILDDGFWETMPQLVRDSEAVRCATLAVQALVLAKGPVPARRPDPAAAADYARAIACYCRALGATRQAADLRETVLCSLFAVFETVDGHQAEAAAHLRNGQRILDDHLAPAPPPPRRGEPLPSRSTLRSQVRHVVRFLALQARGGVLDPWPQARACRRQWLPVDPRPGGQQPAPFLGADGVAAEAAAQGAVYVPNCHGNYI